MSSQVHGDSPFSIFPFFHQSTIQRVHFQQQTKKHLSGYRRGIPDMVCTHTAGICAQDCTGAGTGTGTSMPIPDTSVSSVRFPYRYRKLRKVRYDMDTGTAGTGTDFHAGTGHLVKFGTTSLPVPDTSVSSVQHQYRYRTLRQLWCHINTGTGHFGKFGTTSIPVPGIPVPYRTHAWNAPYGP